MTTTKTESKRTEPKKRTKVVAKRPKPAPRGPRLRIIEAGYRIIEEMRSPEAVREGRHPGVERTLGVVDASGNWLANAFEYPKYWLIDVEYHTIKLAGMNSGGSLLRGCVVRSEDEAYEWLQLIGALVNARERRVA